MTTETDRLTAMLGRGFWEAAEARRVADELPQRLAELRALVRAALHARPAEVALPRRRQAPPPEGQPL